MAESYEGNGDYTHNDEESDFKRKGPSNPDNGEEPNSEQPHLNDKATDYIRDCLIEKSKLDKTFPIAERLLDGEIEKVQTTGRIPTREPKYVDIYREKPIRVSQKILVPVKEHPKFNFVGKLLGPKGNSLRRLQEETLCKMTVLGRNSMKDRAKEEELRCSKDPKYLHLNADLHVEISTIAPPAEAHARIAYAMAELRKYLIPDSNDIIRQEQLRELMDNPDNQEFEGKSAVPPYKKTGPNAPRLSYGYRPPVPGPTHPTSSTRTVMAPKQKILSILDRARSAMDESYPARPTATFPLKTKKFDRLTTMSRHYEEPVPYEQPAYEGYSYAHAPTVSTRVPYEAPEYDPNEYRREYYSHSPSYPVKASTSSTGARPWKSSSGVVSSYHHSSSSRRHDDLETEPPMPSSSKHTHSTREARYKSAPYSRAK